MLDAGRGKTAAVGIGIGIDRVERGERQACVWRTEQKGAGGGQAQLDHQH